MNTDIDDSDCIVVQKGGGEVGKRSVEVVGSPDLPNADASAPSPEAGERAEDSRGGWAMITRRRSKAASAAGGSPQLAKTAKVFASSSELERKRKAEQSMADQIAALREMVLQLIKGQEAQREHAEAERVSQKQEVEELKAIIQTLRQETERQSRATTVLEALSEKSVRTPTYSQAAQAGLQQATKSQKITVSSSQKGRSSPGLARADERAVNIDTGRTKTEKVNFAVVKERLQDGLDKAKVTEGLKIDFLRPGPGDRIEVVFENKEQAEKARKHTQWATGQMPGARVKGEEWFPIKCDMVAKQAVMDGEVGDGKTLKKDVCQAFTKDNAKDGHDFTAMKANWLSKPDLAKKVGSLVIWLKSKLAAEHLLQSGTAIFGATGAYCSKWERREDNLPCFNCNKYGHKQASCTAAPKCALCSGKHSRLKCPRPTELCCPACNKEGHSVFDWKCKLHPNHWKYAGIQKAAAARPTQQVEVQAPKLVKAAGPARQRPVSPVVPVDVQDTTAIRSNNGSETTEHEVDMTDAAETTGSNE
jgi:hypothetical protein